MQSGETPLIAAAKMGRLGIGRLLLAHGACTDPRDGAGRAAVDYLPGLEAGVTHGTAGACTDPRDGGGRAAAGYLPELAAEGGYA